ncbi:MAG: SdpI family protein [Oscillospiraceae bacterium]|nr:SdpI family protein [Oscillospiraceae bacterium]
MKQNKINVILLFLSIINLTISIIYILQLPEIVPTHFDINWICDGMGSRWTAILPAILPLLVGISMSIAEKFAKQANQKPMRITMLLLIIYFIVLNWTILPTMKTGLQIGDKLENSLFVWILFSSLAVLFISMGNYLPTVQQNKTLGFKIKWTLENEECWRVTHRFAGKFMVIMGFIYLAFLIIAMLADLSEIFAFILLFAILSAFIAVTSIYAYQHRNDM